MIVIDYSWTMIVQVEMFELFNACLSHLLGCKPSANLAANMRSEEQLVACKQPAELNTICKRVEA
jgi:hypothetical protein